MAETATHVELIETVKYASPSLNSETHNLVNGLQNWKDKTSKLKPPFNYGLINVSVIGDSITEGDAAGGKNRSDYFEKGYVGLLRAKINEKIGNTGRGFIPVYATTGAPFWAFNGWTNNSAYFGATGLSKQSAISGETATLNFNGVGIGIVLSYLLLGGLFLLYYVGWYFNDKI